MKNVLFASTALVALAGAAAADVTVSGNAEMGIFGRDADGGASGDGVDTQFATDIDVTFTMTGETDNGLSFGASIDIDEGGSGAAAVANDQDDGGIAVFLSGAFGTVTLGDTDGALDWALTEVAFNSGSLRDDETEHAGYNGNAGLDGAGLGDGQILRYDYTVGDFGFAVSVEQLDAAGTPDDAANSIEGETLGIGFRYSGEFAGIDLGFGLGYQNHNGDGGVDADAIGASLNSTFGSITAGISYLALDDDTNSLTTKGGTGSYDHVGVGVGYTEGAISASLNYGIYDFDDGTDSSDLDYDHVGVGIGYSSGAISASANYGHYDYDDGDEAEGFGLSAAYDLGGGASVQFGYGDSEFRDDTNRETFSLGVRMNF